MVSAPPLESVTEQYLAKETRKRGGDCLKQYLAKETRKRGGDCLKFVSPGTAGAFDRLLLLPGGTVMLVEVKRFGEPLSPLQGRFMRRCENRFMRRCEARGTLVEVVDCKEAVDALFRGLQTPIRLSLDDG